MKKLRILFALYIFLLCIGLSMAVAEDTTTLFSMKDLTMTGIEDAEILELTGDSITITEAGTYALSGTITDGSIDIALKEKGTVYLLLNNVTVSNSCGAAMTVSGCSKLVLTLAAGSMNTLTQG